MAQGGGNALETTVAALRTFRFHTTHHNKAAREGCKPQNEWFDFQCLLFLLRQTSGAMVQSLQRFNGSMVHVRWTHRIGVSLRGSTATHLVWGALCRLQFGPFATMPNY